MIVLLVGFIHAIYMYLVLKLYKTQTYFYHIYCDCCVLVGFPFISILILVIQNKGRSYIKTISDLLRHNFLKGKYICISLFNLRVLRYTRVITTYMKNMIEVDMKQ